MSLERRTWVTILLIGVGFGAVAAVALLVAGHALRGLLILLIAAVFAHTAWVFDQSTSPAQARLAVVGNAVVILGALAIAARQIGRAAVGHLTDAPLFLVVALCMSALLHVAVVVVGCESLARLIRGIDAHHMGER